MRDELVEMFFLSMLWIVHSVVVTGQETAKIRVRITESIFHRQSNGEKVERYCRNQVEEILFHGSVMRNARKRKIRLLLD
jgi:hypothetical protein